VYNKYIFKDSKMPKTVPMYNRFVKKDQMLYTLITSKGKVMRFYVRGVAEMYQQLEGGKIVTAAILDEAAATQTA
jgi:hypothetical protein